MNYQLTQEIKDLQEHLRITQENLQNTNGELADTLVERDIRQLELNKVIDLVRSNKIEFEELNKKLEEYKALIKEAKLIQEDIEENSNFILLNSQNEVKELINELHKEEVLRNEKILQLNKEIEELEFSKSIKEVNYKKILKLIEDKEDSAYILQSVVDSIDIKEKELVDITKEIEKLELSFTKRKCEVEEIIYTELSKVKNPMEALDERERVLNKKEKNLEILKLRFETRFKKFFPEQKINI